MLGAHYKEELLGSLRDIFTPESEEVFGHVLTAIAEGRTFFESETVLRALNGNRLAVLVTIAFPPESTTMESVLVSIMDITERNRTHEALQQAQSELAHVARLTTLGELTASIAHEVNQPLAAIVTNGEACLRWMGREPPQLDEARSAVESMISDGMRASEVVWGLRSLSKKTDPQHVRLNINDVIEQVILLIRRELSVNRVALRLELAGALPPVLGDRIQLQQVVMNLAVNGIQAMAAVDGRPRELLIRSLRQQDDRRGASPTGGADDRVGVEVQDTGPGILAENMGQLFNAFFTTRPYGMGMGLSISRSIIEAHGGRIFADPYAGAGATFRFTLPIAQDG